MDLRSLTDRDRSKYNQLVTHVMQSWEWGQFRQKMGIPLARYGIFKNGKMVKAFQLTFHKIPLTKWYVGYLPKGPLPDKDLAQALEQIGKDKDCAFIKVEPNVLANPKPYTVYPAFIPSIKPMFTKYNFIVDLTQSEEQLLKNLHQKARYNIKVAQKRGVTIKTDTSDKNFKDYLKLIFETTNRQQFFNHNTTYHQTVWETLKDNNMVRIMIAYLGKQPLTGWMLINFKDTLYYPYGGSTSKNKDAMASNLVAWEAILLGKKMGLKNFDMWGALGPNPDPRDSWIGFHRFKEKYGGKLVEYLGTYDIIFNQTIYFTFSYIDKFTKLKVVLLKLLGR